MCMLIHLDIMMVEMLDIVVLWLGNMSMWMIFHYRTICLL